MVDQCREGVQHVHLQIAGSAGNHLGRIQRAAPGKHRQVRKQAFLIGIEQVVAPIDGTAQRLLAYGQIPRAASQQLQTGFQPRQHRLGGQDLDAGRGQLDGERQAIETDTDLGHRRRIVIIDLKTGRRQRAPAR